MKHMAKWQRVGEEGHPEAQRGGCWCPACQARLQESHREAPLLGEIGLCLHPIVRKNTTAAGTVLNLAFILRYYLPLFLQQTCCVPSSSRRVEHVQRYWIGKTEASPEGWQPCKRGLSANLTSSQPGSCLDGPSNGGTLLSLPNKHTFFPPRTSQHPHPQHTFVTLQSPVSSARGSAFLMTLQKNRPWVFSIGPLARHHLFSLPVDQRLGFPDSFLGYGYLTCAVSQDPMLGIMVWCCLKVLITSGQRPFMFTLHQTHRFWSWSLLHLCMWVNESSYPYPIVRGS